MGRHLRGGPWFSLSVLEEAMKHSTAPAVAPVIFIALVLAAIPAAFAQESEPLTLAQALQQGKTSLQLRLSYDNADVAGNPTDSATQLSLRTRLGYRTAEWSGFAMFLQFQDVSAAIRTYAPLDPEYDTINDPEVATVHQAYLEYAALPGSTVRVGRQEFRLENGRLLSESPWRQQGQAFDAASISSKSIDKLALIAAYANKMLNSSAQFVDFEHFVFIDADYTGLENQHLYAHAFWLDNIERTARIDTATFGIRASGDFEAFEYQGDYNIQQKYADAEGGGGDMISGFAAIKFGEFRAGPGYTKISGADGKDHAFDTLIGTTHQFQGFANVFAGTNGAGVVNGVVEYYVLVGGTHGGARWQVSHHILNQESQDQAYGDENDARIIYTYDENLTLSAEVGLYAASTDNESTLGTADKTVWTLRSDYRF